MRVELEPVILATIAARLRQHFVGLPSRIDSYLEERILASRHYELRLDGDAAGLASVYEEHTLTHFSLDRLARRHGEAPFAAVCRLEQVNAALVPTGDEYFLALAMDRYRSLAMQAYVFAEASEHPAPVPDRFSLRLARDADIELIRSETGDFFEPVDRRLAATELFVMYDGNTVAGFGILEPSRIQDRVASIGMFTVAAHRRQGTGTATILGLRDECHRRGYQAVAGCWYYNHRSKQTLERAGMFAASRLLRVEF